MTVHPTTTYRTTAPEPTAYYGSLHYATKPYAAAAAYPAETYTHYADLYGEQFHHHWQLSAPIVDEPKQAKATRAKRAKQDTKTYKKEWYAAHRDAQKEKMKAWYEKNKAKRLLQMKAYNSRRLQMQREASKAKSSPPTNAEANKASLSFILCD